MEDLEKWLANNNANLIWATKQSKPKGSNVSVYCYQIRSSTCLVVKYDNGGWDIFTSCHSNRIDETLNDADARLDNKHVISEIEGGFALCAHWDSNPYGNCSGRLLVRGEPLCETCFHKKDR